MTCNLSRGTLLTQMKDDWFGKEVQTGYTYTYIWQANQFGHFNLGFLPTIMFLGLIQWQWGTQDPFGWVLALPVGQILFWSIKEIRDYIIAVSQSGTQFTIDKKDIGLDAFTAVYFIAIGVISAYASLFGSQWILFSFLVFILLVFLPSFPVWYWLSRKMCFQKAGIPFQYRLADFPTTIEDLEPATILAFAQTGVASVQPGVELKHLVLFGPPRTGKTSFAAGVATERTFNKNMARYSTYVNFIKLASSVEDEPTVQEGSVLWPWTTCQLLVVDDITTEVGSIQLTSAKEFSEMMALIPDANRRALQKLQTVWILGDMKEKDNWLDALTKTLHCNRNEIGVINLKEDISVMSSKKVRLKNR